MIKKVIYLSYTRLDYSLNSVSIKGLNENEIGVIGSHAKDRGIRSLIGLISFYLRNSKNADVVMVGYDSPVLAVFLRFFCRKQIVYNAVLSVYERMVVSRKLAKKLSVKSIYYWVIDFLAVHSADLTMVESWHQADYFKKLFKVSEKKVYKNWIGVDENNFFYDSTVPKFNVFTVLFRGALMPEAGVEYLIKAAKILEKEGINFVMHGGGLLVDQTKKMIKEMDPKNLSFNSDLLPANDLRIMMQKCHISLGQLSDHDRLTRTIPHKAYESLAMQLPYLTASNKGILELLKDDKTCIVCEPANAESLARKILWIKNNYSLAKEIAENGYRLYQDKLKSHILAKNLLDKIGT